MSDPQVYTGPERRSSNAATLEAVEAIVARLLREYEGREQEFYKSAFPGGDPVKHREYHEAKIDAARAEQRFWETASKAAIENSVEGLFGALKIIIALALTGLAFKLGLALPFMGGK